MLDIAVPDLLIYEVANVLRYKRNLSAEDVCRSVQDIYDLDLSILPVTADLVSRAIRLARQYDVTVYDAAFVACAENVGASLVTAHDALCRKMGSNPAIVHLESAVVS